MSMRHIFEPCHVKGRERGACDMVTYKKYTTTLLENTVGGAM